MINIAPAKEGTIDPIFSYTLLEMGKWLSINGEAIYSTVPYKYQNDTIHPDVWYTSRPGVIYAILLKWQFEDVIIGGVDSSSEYNITMLGYSHRVYWKPIESGIIIMTANIKANTLPSQYAWVFKIEKKQKF